MFGIGYRLKVKFWILLFEAATWLLNAVEKKASKSTGLRMAGTFVVNPQGRIVSGMIKEGEQNVTVFGPN